MKIALACVRIVDRDVPHNLSQMHRCMEEAKENGADLVCFGEAFLQGFNALSWRYEEDREIALTDASPELAQIRRWTQEIGIDVLFGYNERADETIYSTCALMAEGKLIHRYRRISKGWKEYWRTDAHYREGETVEVFAYRGRQCVIGLCGDLWDFPEKFALGEELLFWPVYVCWTEEEWENGGKLEYAQQAQKCCNHTLYVNSICDGDAFGGAAQFLNGGVQREWPLLREGMLYVTI